MSLKKKSIHFIYLYGHQFVKRRKGRLQNNQLGGEAETVLYAKACKQKIDRDFEAIG